VCEASCRKRDAKADGGGRRIASRSARRGDASQGRARVRRSDKRSSYPSLTLTAGGGGRNTALSDLLANPIGAIAAAISLLFLQANEARHAARVTDAEYERGDLTLQDALLEVEDAHSARTTLATRSAQLEAALTGKRHGEARSPRPHDLSHMARRAGPPPPR
jgi:outer membrane protein TolC